MGGIGGGSERVGFVVEAGEQWSVHSLFDGVLCGPG